MRISYKSYQWSTSSGESNTSIRDENIFRKIYNNLKNISL